MMARKSWLVTDKAAWAARPGRDVTGSVISALFGRHQHGMSAEQLVRLIRGEWRPIRNAAMMAGRALERTFPEAIEARRPGSVIERVRHYYRLPEHRLGAVADFWLGADGLIEAKTVSARQWAQWGGRPPLAYGLQVACEMLCADRACGLLAAMVRPTGPLFLYDLPRSAEVDERLLAAVAAWWRAFDAGEIAPPAASAGMAELLLPEIAPGGRPLTAPVAALPPPPPFLPSALASAACGALVAGRAVRDGLRRKFQDQL